MNHGYNGYSRGICGGMAPGGGGGPPAGPVPPRGKRGGSPPGPGKGPGGLKPNGPRCPGKPGGNPGGGTGRPPDSGPPGRGPPLDVVVVELLGGEEAAVDPGEVAAAVEEVEVADAA